MVYIGLTYKIFHLKYSTAKFLKTNLQCKLMPRAKVLKESELKKKQMMPGQIAAKDRAESGQGTEVSKDFCEPFSISQAQLGPEAARSGVQR